IQNSALKSNQPLNRPTYWGQFKTRVLCRLRRPIYSGEVMEASPSSILRCGEPYALALSTDL
ncbi:hypothetical protein, partial [Rhizobium indigoferae]|uniref:hypothetical protein n=1 Tax=Rhizobium indigoferae TaxID=158891 RepID=UPI001AED8729